MNKKISIYDIANKTGVSPASVSYVINGKNKVSEETKEKVLKSIEELGYAPNLSARALTTGRSKLIGILLPLDDPSIAFLQNSFYSEFIGGFEKGLLKQDYDVVIGARREEKDLANWLNSRNLDGLVVIGSPIKEAYRYLNNLNIPIVLVDNYDLEAKNFNLIQTNDKLGMFLATEHLLKLGHKKIGFVGSPKKYPVDKVRFEGFKEALNKYNQTFDNNYLFETNATFDCGYLIADKIIKTDVTAILSSGDMMSIGIIKRLNTLGYKIPESLSIVGYDDVVSSSQIFPSLTTIHQGIEEKGKKSAEIIIDKLNKNEQTNDIFVFEPTLIQRDSVKKNSM